LYLAACSVLAWLVVLCSVCWMARGATCRSKAASITSLVSSADEALCHPRRRAVRLAAARGRLVARLVCIHAAQDLAACSVLAWLVVLCSVCWMARGATCRSKALPPTPSSRTTRRCARETRRSPRMHPADSTRRPTGDSARHAAQDLAACSVLAWLVVLCSVCWMARGATTRRCARETRRSPRMHPADSTRRPTCRRVRAGVASSALETRSSRKARRQRPTCCARSSGLFCSSLACGREK
jgi:hypothetical protein